MHCLEMHVLAAQKNKPMSMFSICFKIYVLICSFSWGQGHNKRCTVPQVPSHHEGAKWLRGTLKSPNNVTITSFITVHLFLKDLTQFWTWGAKLASCPGYHLTLLGPWVGLQQTIGYYLLCLFLLVVLLCTVDVCSSSVTFVWSYKVIFSEK